MTRFNEDQLAICGGDGIDSSRPWLRYVKQQRAIAPLEEEAKDSGSIKSADSTGAIAQPKPPLKYRRYSSDMEMYLQKDELLFLSLFMLYCFPTSNLSPDLLALHLSSI